MLEQKTLDRFWSKVNKLAENDCWEWMGALHKAGYGSVTINYVNCYAHRVSWEIHHGAIPQGMYVCHHCDNPRCVNPSHLFLGTPNDNMQDAKRKRRLIHDEKSREAVARANRKLSESELEELRSIHVPYVNTKELAQRYGVTRQTINNLVRGTERTESEREIHKAAKARRNQEVVQDYQSGQFSMAEVAKRHGIDAASVCRIVAKHTRQQES